MDANELQWHAVAPASALEPSGKAWVRAGGLAIAVFRQGERLFALADSCPHSGASLCGGLLEDGHVRCPAHGLRFRLSDGLLAGSPPGTPSTSLGVRTFPVRIAGNAIQIGIEP